MNPKTSRAEAQRAQRGICHFLLGLLLAFSLQPSAFALTTFTFQLYNSDGSPETNPATLSPVGWNQIVVYGTNIVIAKTVNLVPGTNGFGTNAAEPNAYKLSVPTSTGVPITTYANIPDTATVFPLAMYLSNAPAVFVASSLQAMLTNALGISSITNLLGLVPMAATAAGVTNAMGFALTPPTFGSLTNELGFWPATNSVAGVEAALAFAPMPNTAAALTNLAGGVPVLTNNPQFALALTNANAFYATNLQLLTASGFTALGGLTNAFITNANGSYTPLLGWTNPTAPQFTGTVSNSVDGILFRINITNGIVISTNTP